MRGEISFKEVSFRQAWLLAMSVLICSAVVYRVAASHLRIITDRAVKQPVSLKKFPAETGLWIGKEVRIPLIVQRVAENDEYLSRLYTNRDTNQWVNLYVAYTARPRTMLGHRPQICYPAGGWVLDYTEHIKEISSSGVNIPCLLHRFHKPAPGNDEIVVLNFYILNGQITDSESGFSGLDWRTPNINGDAAYYVAQVQISSDLENSVLAAAREMADLILGFFPDKDGRVRALENVRPAGKAVFIGQHNAGP
jgi:hypothetical protein